MAAGECRVSGDVFQVLKNVYNPLQHNLDDKELQKRITVALTVPPLMSILRVNTMKTKISTAKEHLQSALNRQNEESGRSLISKQHEEIPDILITFSKDQPKTIIPNAKEVIVDELCGIAVLRGADVFACGVLGTPPVMLKGDAVSVYADLEGLCRKGCKRHYNGQKYFVGNGTVILNRCEIFKEVTPRGVAIKMKDKRYDHQSFNHLDPGMFFAQNLPSVLVAHNLEPSPGDIILDMCAAPGGKTSHVALLMENKGILYAVDKSKSKIKKLEEMCKLMHLSCIRCVSFDSTKICDSKLGSQALTEKPPFPPGVMDKIILDPPCSALGQRPQLQCKATAAELSSFSFYQKKIIQQAVQLLKPGGTLIYSTCTLTIDENEDQVAWTLENFPQLELVPQSLHLGGAGIAGHNLDSKHCALVQRFDPCLLSITKDCFKGDNSLTVNQDTIGFFTAKFIKCSDISLCE